MIADHARVFHAAVAPRRGAPAARRAAALAGVALALLGCASRAPRHEPSPPSFSGDERAILLAAARHVAGMPELQGAALCVTPGLTARDTALSRQLAEAMGATVPPARPGVGSHDCTVSWRTPDSGRVAPAPPQLILGFLALVREGPSVTVRMSASGMLPNLVEIDVTVARRTAGWEATGVNLIRM